MKKYNSYSNHRKDSAQYSVVQSAIGLKPTVSVVARSGQFDILTLFPDCLRGGEDDGRAPGASDYICTVNQHAGTFTS